MHALNLQRSFLVSEILEIDVQIFEKKNLIPMALILIQVF